MKHKKFNEIYPYTYYVIHKLTGFSYYGVRIANFTRNNKSPSQDLGRHYFTSLGKHSKWFRDLFIKDPSNFNYGVHYTFDTIEEAYTYEKLMIKQLKNKKLWLNKCNA